jgi:surface antigen
MYISTSQFNSPAWGLNYIDEKLKLIADAAAEQNKTIEIVIIFSGKQNGMASYFTQNTFLSAWQKVLQGFNSWGTTWGQSTAQNKNRLKFVGYFVYTYQDSDTNPNVTGVKDLPYIW